MEMLHSEDWGIGILQCLDEVYSPHREDGETLPCGQCTDCLMLVGTRKQTPLELRLEHYVSFTFNTGGSHNKAFT